MNTSEKGLEFGRDFQISHYAGDVKYSVEGFIEKNRDSLFQDFKRLLYSRSVRVHLYWSKSKSDIASRWIHGESNSVFTLNSDKYERK